MRAQFLSVLALLASCSLVASCGTVDASGNLAGDLTFGGRMKTDGTIDFTDFDHNEARAFNAAILTPEDPLTAVNQLAAQVKAAGVTSISGDVIVDDRLFTASAMHPTKGRSVVSLPLAARARYPAKPA